MPAGVPDPGGVALTVTVKVKLEPTVGLDALSETTVVEPERVGTLEPTVTESVLDALFEKSPSVSVNWAWAL